ncbi:hypothetical protein lerEdw1_005915 [Lerista edwardsae]|nr:hypothetical protein lerEdw1_005915 [Lerista edwardsae]
MKLLAGLGCPALLLLLLVPLCLSEPQPTVKPPSHETSPSHLSNSTTSPSKAISNTTAAPQNATSSRPVSAVSNSTSTTPTAATVNTTANATTANPTPHTHVTKATAKTVPSPSATATPKATVAQIRSSGFSVGSFIGGIVLTLVILAIGYIGCRTYHAKRGVQYRTMYVV